MRHKPVKNMFRIAGYFCICAATLFIAFNLFISAILPSPSNDDGQYLSKRQPPKKVLYVTKYAENKHGKYQQITDLLILFDGLYKTISIFPDGLNIVSKKYLSFYSYKDLSVQYCCLLI